MSKNTKIWKPGQLVTIENKVYRVVKNRFGCMTCENVYIESRHLPCVMCMNHKDALRPWILKELKPNK